MRPEIDVAKPSYFFCVAKFLHARSHDRRTVGRDIEIANAMQKFRIQREQAPGNGESPRALLLLRASYVMHSSWRGARNRFRARHHGRVERHARSAAK